MADRIRTPIQLPVILYTDKDGRQYVRKPIKLPSLVEYQAPPFKPRDRKAGNKYAGLFPLPRKQFFV